MSKRKPRNIKQASTALATTQQETRVELSIFGPEDTGHINLFDYTVCYDNGQYYELPVSPEDLYRLLSSNVHHPSAIQAKVNILLSTFDDEASSYLTTRDFKQIAFQFLVFGNAYLEIRRNVFDEIIGLKPLPALYMRRCSNKKDYILLNWPREKSKIYEAKNIIHLMEPDLKQEIYGMPTYLGALHSMKLNESATVFRRRFFDNGSHAGFILYATDSQINEKDFDVLRDQLRKTKGGGNFKNILLRASGGSKDGLTLIPISEVAAKDEFLNIKNITRDDVLAMHRIPPQLMAVIPTAAGGFGDVAKAAAVFNKNEIKPIQKQLLEVNKLLDIDAFTFNDYVIDGAVPGS